MSPWFVKADEHIPPACPACSVRVVFAYHIRAERPELSDEVHECERHDEKGVYTNLHDHANGAWLKKSPDSQIKSFDKLVSDNLWAIELCCITFISIGPP